MDNRRLLGIYLNDHLAGSTIGRELTRRAGKSNEGTPLGELLARLEREIVEDRGELLRVMQYLGVRRSRVKPALAIVAERLGRAKLNGRVLGYSPLSRVLELEGLVMGVTGKRAMWRALRELPALAGAGVDFDALEQRADAQIAELERHRSEAARLAFGGREREGGPAGAGPHTATRG